MEDTFGTSNNVDPALFGEGNSAEGAETESKSTETQEGTQQAATKNPQKEVQQKAPDKQETPKLYAGKYKTPEDMEKAYLEAQKLLTQTRMELSTARKNSNPDQQDTSKQKQQNQPEQNFDWAAAYQKDPMGTTYLMIKSMLQETVNGINGRIDPITSNYELNRTLDEIMGKYPDFVEYSDKAIEVLEKSPELYKLPNYLEVAYRLAKADDLQTKAETAFEAGKNAAYDLDQQKSQKVFDNKSTKDEAQLTPEEKIIRGIMGAGGAWRSFAQK